MQDNVKTVLVAEDNAALRRVIGFALKGCGFEVTAAADGLEAWRAASEKPFDLIVTDQQMPNMTGVELVEHVRKSDVNAKAPVILLTAKGLELELDRLREQYGVSAMLHKPFSPAQLGALAEELVGQLV